MMDMFIASKTMEGSASVFPVITKNIINSLSAESNRD